MLAEEAAYQGFQSFVDDLGKIGAAVRRLLDLIERYLVSRDRPVEPIDLPAPAEAALSALVSSGIAVLTRSVEKAWAETFIDELHVSQGTILVVDDDPLNR